MGCLLVWLREAGEERGLAATRGRRGRSLERSI